MFKRNTQRRSGWMVLSLLVGLAVLASTGCDEESYVVSDDYAYADTYYGFGAPDTSWADGGSFYSNSLLGTAVSSSGDSGYIALGDGDFVSWGP